MVISSFKSGKIGVAVTFIATLDYEKLHCSYGLHWRYNFRFFIIHYVIFLFSISISTWGEAVAKNNSKHKCQIKKYIILPIYGKIMK